jgi:hypothetical protein
MQSTFICSEPCERFGSVWEITMNKHLSEDEICRSFIGSSTMEEERHVQNCAQCREEVERLRIACSLFRDAMKDWTALRNEVIRLPIVATLAKPRGFESIHWRWALIGAVTILLAVIPMYKSQYFPRNETQIDRAAGPSNNALVQSGTREDILLMEAVISHRATIPAPMEPVMALLPTDETQRIKARGGMR